MSWAVIWSGILWLAIAACHGSKHTANAPVSKPVVVTPVAPAIEPSTLDRFVVTQVARVRISQYWLDERDGPSRPESRPTVTVPVVAVRDDKLRVVLEDGNAAIAIWIPRGDAVELLLARDWKRPKPAGGYWGRNAVGIAIGTCLFSDVSGSVVGVVTEPVHYAKSIGQGWASVAVYSPIGIIRVAAYSTMERDGPFDPYPRRRWYACPRSSTL